MSELKVERKENMCGGEGHILIKHILGEKELNGKCGLYAEVTIEPGCSLGYHEHHNESETYYILRGEGDYNDNGTVRPVKAGDVTFTPDGKGHGLKNTGDTDLVFMALIKRKDSRSKNAGACQKNFLVPWICCFFNGCRRRTEVRTCMKD